MAVEPLDTLRSFATPEHIAFRYRVAGPMARGLAYVIDWLLRGIVLLLLFLVLAMAGGEFGLGMWLVVLFVIDWFYGGLFEWLWRGQTPGKRALGIRVIGVDGLPAGPGACFLRNVMRTADAQPLPLFLVGLASMCVFRGFQRLGDLAAGTLVIYDQQVGGGRLPRFTDQRLERSAAELPADLLDRIDARTMRAITQYVARRHRVGSGRRNEMADYLATPLREILDLEGKPSPDHLLCAIYLRAYQGDEQRGAGRAAAVIRSRSADWKALERMVGRVESSAAASFAFSHHYRSACADLAIADAYQLPPSQIAYLHDLVARAHLAFYRRLTLPLRSLVDLLLVRVPGMLYGDACLRIALLAFFGVFAGSALLAWWDPQMALRFNGEDQIADLREMYASAPKDRSLGDAGLMGGFYIQHNVGIALTCFASGIFLGVGSLIYLVYNGLALGLIFGYMARVEGATRDHFFEFVSAHGPFELTGIAIAGAAGLRLGLGLVSRRGLPWRESLQAAATRAFWIVLVACLMVALAAPIEAFISPSALSLGMKRAVGVTCLVIVLLYLFGLGWRGRRILDARGEAV